MGVEYTDFRYEQDGLTGLDILMPVEELKESAAELGYLNIPLDTDGVNRRTNIDVIGDYESFAEAIYKARFGSKQILCR